jgi:putative addiction module component (TIGR02574 family)
MSIQIQIDQLTIAEKLRIMEELWDDLRTRAKDVSVAQWQRDLLEEREQLLEANEAQFGDWETAKKRITERTS